MPADVWSPVPWCRALAAHHRRAFDEARALAIVPPRHSLYTEACLAALPSQGDRLLQDLRDALHHFDNMGYTRSTHQREFHASMMAACARHIFKDEFTDNFVRILQENGWDEARQEVMICCPRRFGKTFAVGMYVAAYLYTQPDTEICIFSPSRRQSEKMLELVKTFLHKLPGASDRIIKANRERLWLRGDVHRADDIRKCSSYPSKVSTLKGVGGDLIICEEAAAMDTAVFYEVRAFFGPFRYARTHACHAASSNSSSDTALAM
jgi:hypothetical protein